MALSLDLLSTVIHYGLFVMVCKIASTFKCSGNVHFQMEVINCSSNINHISHLLFLTGGNQKCERGGFRGQP